MGPIGLSVTEFARHWEAVIIAADVSIERLAFSRETLKIERCLDARGDLTAQLQDALDGELPTVVFDCTGSSESMHQSFRYTAPGGKLVFVGLFTGDVTFHDPKFHRCEMTLLSSRNLTADDFRRVIDLMEKGRLDISPSLCPRTQINRDSGARSVGLGAATLTSHCRHLPMSFQLLS
jgi:threonine dehydrogenase-like Zn-dependent dehydrogenase